MLYVPLIYCLRNQIDEGQWMTSSQTLMKEENVLSEIAMSFEEKEQSKHYTFDDFAELKKITFLVENVIKCVLY